jgi:hypothetical protein
VHLFAAADAFTPRVDAPGKHTAKAGTDKPGTVVPKGVVTGWLMAADFEPRFFERFSRFLSEISV